MRDDMEKWRVREITLWRSWDAPEDWIYVVNFDDVPTRPEWHGIAPSMHVVVRMDGTVPEPTVFRSEAASESLSLGRKK